MAKKQSKKINKDKMFVEGLRESIILALNESIGNYVKNNSMERFDELCDMVKKSFEMVEEELVLSKIQYERFCMYVNYMYDIYCLKSNGVEDLKPYLKKIKDRIVLELKKENMEWDFFICINRIGAKTDIYFDRMGRYKEVSTLSSVMMLYSIFITSYLTSFKNKKIDKFYDINDSIKAKFLSSDLLSYDRVEAMFYIRKGGSRVLAREGLKDFVKLIDVKSSDYSVSDIAQEYLHLSTGYNNVSFTKEIKNFPFVSDNGEDKYDLDLTILPENRKYAVPSAGVRFEFIDKSKAIDYIEMKEAKDNVVFCVGVVNKDEIIFVDEYNNQLGLAYSRKNNSKKIFDIPFILNKKVLTGKWTLEDLVMSVKYISFTPIVNSSEIKNSLLKIIKHCLYCMYSAYYNPRLFASDVKMFTVNRKEKGGYKRTESFRIAHIRKLPVGSKMSENAKLEAKKAGFGYIEEGYTFVRASHLDKEPTSKKIIKIDS